MPLSPLLGPVRQALSFTLLGLSHREGTKLTYIQRLAQGQFKEVPVPGSHQSPSSVYLTAKHGFPSWTQRPSFPSAPQTRLPRGVNGGQAWDRAAGGESSPDRPLGWARTTPWVTAAQGPRKQRTLGEVNRRAGPTLEPQPTHPDHQLPYLASAGLQLGLPGSLRPGPDLQCGEIPGQGLSS